MAGKAGGDPETLRGLHGQIQHSMGDIDTVITKVQSSFVDAQVDWQGGGADAFDQYWREGGKKNLETMHANLAVAGNVVGNQFTLVQRLNGVDETLPKLTSPYPSTLGA